MALLLSVLFMFLPPNNLHCDHAISHDFDGAAYPLTEEQVSSHFGIRIDPITGETRRHEGVDLVPVGDRNVRAIFAGTVVYAAPLGGYGNLVSVRHKGGYLSLYAHLGSTFVSVGEELEKGNLIGLVGATGKTTGEHLHFEIRRQGCVLNPELILSHLGKGAEG